MINLTKNEKTFRFLITFFWYKIRQIGDPILRKTSLAVTEKDFQSGLVTNTLNTMMQILNGIKSISDENGNAISAPQVGTLLRIVLLRVDGEFMPMINPELVEKSDDTFLFEEECFSFYNMRAKVKRHQNVVVHFLSANQETKMLTLTGEFSGLIQHEIDHLNGIFFLDRVENYDTMRSIDYVYKNNPKRLNVVKEMCNYMSSE